MTTFESERERLIGKLSDSMDPDNARDFVDRVIQEATRSPGGVGSVADYISHLAGQRGELLAALKMILAEPHGCPMCDSGKLRNPAKEHWDTCGFARAVSAVTKAEGQ